MPIDDDDDFPRGNQREMLTLLRERQRAEKRELENHEKRIEAMEKKQAALDAMLNKWLGAIAIISGAGVFIGWLASFGGGISKLFR